MLRINIRVNPLLPMLVRRLYTIEKDPNTLRKSGARRRGAELVGGVSSPCPREPPQPPALLLQFKTKTYFEQGIGTEAGERERKGCTAEQTGQHKASDNKVPRKYIREVNKPSYIQ
ncbi:hypothetical protein WMY93_029933 [Mugilogobius chulae]|uniref:Uncharacterized protein n=1 Tax=Mugilogobius chulae TaxID=88201 RepID=A0AAW0MX96_9GOBI